MSTHLRCRHSKTHSSISQPSRPCIKVCLERIKSVMTMHDGAIVAYRVMDPHVRGALGSRPRCFRPRAR